MAKKKKKKQAGGLMGELLKAGVVSEKQARGIRREHRDEVKKIKKEQGLSGNHEAEEHKRQAQLKLVEEKQKREQARQKQLHAEQNRRRLETLLRGRVAAGGNRRFYFVRSDKVIDFVEADDSTVRQLGSKEAVIVQKLEPRAGDYWILPNTTKLHEIRSIAPEMVLFPQG